MRVNQPQSGPAQIDPAYGADFAWNAATGSSVGAPVSTNNGRRSAVKSGIGLNNGYAVVGGPVPSMYATTWTESGVVVLDPTNNVLTLSAREDGQAVIINTSGFDLILWGQADVSIGVSIPAGLVHYTVRRVGSTHTAWVNGVMVGSASASQTPNAYSGINPAIGAHAGGGLNVGTGPLNGANAVLGLFRTKRALSDAQCLALSRNHWDAYASDQEDIFVPATGGGSSYSYTAAGGFVLSGVATKVRGAARAASGGITTGGAAGAARGVTRSTSGGLTFAGAANQAKGRKINAAGGLTLGGAATILRGVARSASGGVLFAGHTNVSFFSAVQSLVVTPAGGIVFAGASLVVRGARKVASGGLSLAGRAGTTFFPPVIVIAVKGILPIFARRRRRK